MTGDGWRPMRNFGARLHEVVLRGMRAVVLENQRLRVTVLADKGTDVVEFLDKRRDVDYCWLSPIGLRNPHDIAGGAGDDVALFVDQYEGGWQEVFPNGGLPTTYRGAALGQHGEVAGQRWDYDIVADDPDEVAVRFSVRTRRFPYHLTKTLRLRAGEPVLHAAEELVNESPVALEAMWGQHIVYGAPFLRPGCRIRLPDGISVVPERQPPNPRRRVDGAGPWPWPTVPATGGGTVDLSVIPPAGEPSDLLYLTGFRDGWYEISDPGAGTGLRVDWDTTVLPYLWLWQELGDSADYPWWGRVYTVGLEPQSSIPGNGLNEAIAHGTALRLEPHSRRALSWSVSLLEEDSHG